MKYFFKKFHFYLKHGCREGQAAFNALLDICENPYFNLDIWKLDKQELLFEQKELTLKQWNKIFKLLEKYNVN